MAVVSTLSTQVRAHQAILGSLPGSARTNLLLADQPVRIVVVEDLERSAAQFLIADEHRRRPSLPIPILEAPEDRPFALLQAKVAELANPDRIIWREHLHIAQRRDRLATGTEEKYPSRTPSGFA